MKTVVIAICFLFNIHFKVDCTVRKARGFTLTSQVRHPSEVVPIEGCVVKPAALFSSGLDSMLACDHGGLVTFLQIRKRDEQMNQY